MRYFKISSIFLISLLYSQFQDNDYPDWFLTPPGREYIVGLTDKVSNESVTLVNAYFDALAIYELLQNGTISTNTISYRQKIADSVGISLGSQLKLPDGVQLIKKYSIGNLFCCLFTLSNENKNIKQSKKYLSQKKITAIGKQTFHPDRIYETWASAEIEAFKELSRIKKSKVQSLLKKDKDMRKVDKIIYLQSNSYFSSARIERRWIDHNTAYVKVSDLY